MISLTLSRLLVAAFLMAVPAVAQDVTGTVQGTVTDPAGGRVAGAKVNLINEGTGVTTTRDSNSEGEYLFNFVPPVRYTVSATLTGFKTFNSTGNEVGVNKTTRIDLTLQVGSVAESLNVTAEAVRIDAVSAQVSTNVSTKMVTDLPSSSRNALSMPRWLLA
jgi:hypothetical protein